MPTTSTAEATDKNDGVAAVDRALHVATALANATCSYPVLWNAFKRIATGMSQADKAMLFAGTAARVYRLG